MTGFVEVADRVYVLRYPVLDVNVTLIAGDGAALVVDTLSSAPQATELLGQIRRVTRVPLRVVNTHHHFDHCFGNATFAADGAPIWAHVEAVAMLRSAGRSLQRQWYDEWRPTEPALAEQLRTATVWPAAHTVHVESILDVGGRPVVLWHPGPGHTAGDLVVSVPDAGVLLAGDLVEESGPPSFDDAYPLAWPEALAAVLLRLDRATVVVPGHGALVDRAFVERQHADLTALDWLIREGYADGARPEEVAARAPFDAGAARVAVVRGYASLDGKL